MEISDARAAILSEARKKFARMGFHGASINSILKETGLSKGALYWYFESKTALFKAVLEKDIERILQHFMPSSDSAEEDPLDFFLSRGEEYLEILWNDTELRLIWTQVFLEAQRGDEQGQELSQFVRDTVKMAYYNTLFPIVSRSFPGFDQKVSGFTACDLFRIAEFFFNGLMINLGVTLDLEEATKYWRFMVTRFVEGGKSYVV